jgi:outer membrane biogenesis lipoprotein LolB
VTVRGACSLSLAAALLLGACAGTAQRSSSADAAAPERANVNLSGYSASFKQGYAQGCDSARHTRQRDAERYRTDTDYMMGWNDGYSMCGRR